MAEPVRKPTPRTSKNPNQKPTVSADTRASSARSSVNAQSKPNVIKTSNNLYKKGKLSKNARFSPRKIKWTPIIIALCVLLAFIMALVLGNHLNKLVENSQNTTTSPSDVSGITPPSANKVDPRKNLHAYFADLTGADPEKSLSELTATAREKGNALLVNIKIAENELLYSSNKGEELGFSAKENLTLTRLNNHFEYYNDFAVGYFVSDFSANLDAEESLKLQTNEILILEEATKRAFGQIVIEFSGSFTKSNLIHYQAYLLNLKLACPNIPIGIKIGEDFLSNPDNSGSVASLLQIADFFLLDLGEMGANEIKSTLAPLVYFVERYDCVVMLSSADEDALAERMAALEDKGIKNYIVK